MSPHGFCNIEVYYKGPIFSKSILKCRWLLEHENLSKVSKYIGKFLNFISQISERIVTIYNIRWRE